MIKVITYGTYDLMHQGHINLLKRAKALGDYLIVGVTTDNYDRNRGKLNVQNSLMKRIEDIKSLGIADEIIIEEYEGQKIDDINKYSVDIFAIGSDWIGKFDYLDSYCKVVYLERTKGVSSTELRAEKNATLRLGIIGNGRIAKRFIVESKYVSGIEVVGVYNPKIESAMKFYNENELEFYSSDLDDFLSRVDAVYIASPHGTHYDYAKASLTHGRHTICEKPLCLKKSETEELFDIALTNKVTLIEALKTAYSPGFNHLYSLVRSGCIGEILDVNASFSMLKSGNLRELDPDQDGGSITELATYTLLPIFKFLGLDYKELRFFSKVKNGIDEFTKGIFVYDKAVATFIVALKAKTEGQLVVTGTKGYVYVPAPWWKTSYFEIRYEDTSKNQKYFYKFEGDGLRYEISDFVQQINNPDYINYKLTSSDSIKFSEVIEKYKKGENITLI